MTHVGLFAFEPSFLAEVGELFDAWGRAVDELQEDSALYRNRLFDRAAEVAVHREVMTGDQLASAAIGLGSLFFRRLWKRRQRKVFTPQECARYRDALAALEDRLGGEDGLIGRVQTMDDDVTPDDIQAVYRAFKRVLHAAAERGLGFTWTTRDDDAEAVLAARIREREQRRREHEERTRHLPDQTQEEVQAELDRFVERVAAKYGRREPDPRDAYQVELMAELILLPDADAHEAIARLYAAARRPLPGRARGYPADDTDTKPFVRERGTVHDTLRHAESRFSVRVLDQMARGTAFESGHGFGDGDPLEDDIADYERDPDNTCPMYGHYTHVYTARHVVALLAVMDAWRADKGADGMVDELVRWSGWGVRPLVERAARGYHDALAAAAERGCGMALVFVLS